jgi:hypothetical protein
MKRLRAFTVLCAGVLLMAACAVPMGGDLVINRDGSIGTTDAIDYNLQTYVPIPKTGERPVTVVSGRADLDAAVVWKDQSGAELPGLTVFGADTVYRAEIKLTPRKGYAFSPSSAFGYHPGKITAQSDNMGAPTRTVTVTYNNSDDADITFITDYNLQSYVPIPLAGEPPVWTDTSRGDVAIDAAWQVENPPNSGSFADIAAGDTSYTFVLGRVYRAAIRLRANSGYRFTVNRNFEYPAGTVTIQPGPDNDPAGRDLSPVTYMAARTAAVVSDLNLTPYIPRPASAGGGALRGTPVYRDRNLEGQGNRGGSDRFLSGGHGIYR